MSTIDVPHDLVAMEVRGEYNGGTPSERATYEDR